MHFIRRVRKKYKKREETNCRRVRSGKGFTPSTVSIRRALYLFYSSAKLPFCVCAAQSVLRHVFSFLSFFSRQCAGSFFALLSSTCHRKGRRPGPTLSPGFTFYSSFLLSLPVSLFPLLGIGSCPLNKKASREEKEE